MIKNKKVFILDLARSGFEAAKLLSKSNNKILVTDIKNDDKEKINELKKLNIQVIITDKQENLLDETFDLIIKNPGIKYDNPVVVKAKKLKIPVINEIELSYHYLDKKVKIIGVTGSNGKTTTVNLIYNMMLEDKKSVFLGGNVGVPLSSFVHELKPSDYLVLEISDHQLVDMYDFKTNISVLTNISPTHLDFHPSYEVYKKMKMKIFNHHTKKDYGILNLDNDESRIAENIKDTKLYFGSSNKAKCYYTKNAIYYNNKKIIDTKDILLKGSHNYENITASILACKIYDVSDEAIVKVLKTFKGVEHRLEYVGVKNGIKFYNDSKATNCVSTLIALKSFNDPTIVLLGGTDRDHSFHDLDKCMKNVKHIICYGETKDRIEKYAKEIKKPVTKVNNLLEATKKSLSIAKPGDVILLSPACASWDQYKNFEERGLEFKRLVKEYIDEK